MNGKKLGACCVLKEKGNLMNKKDGLFRHLQPNAGTVLVVALMLFAYRAWADPEGSLQTVPAAPLDS